MKHISSFLGKSLSYAGTLCIVTALFLAAALFLTGCGNPCNDLIDKICLDLGPADCQIFQSDEGIWSSVLPTAKIVRKGELAQCEMHIAAQNYNSYTLPYVKYRIAALANPSIPAPNLPGPQMVDGLFAGFSSYFLYLLFPLCIAGIFIYTFVIRKKMSQGQ